MRLGVRWFSGCTDGGQWPVDHPDPGVDNNEATASDQGDCIGDAVYGQFLINTGFLMEWMSPVIERDQTGGCEERIAVERPKIVERRLHQVHSLFDVVLGNR